MTYSVVDQCRCCGVTSTLHEYLDLGPQPLANAYHKPGDVQVAYPLKIMYCKNCWHSQLNIVVDPDEMFKHYLYASGTNPALQQYSNEFASWLVDLYKRADGTKPYSVLDIACNDGTQLNSFKSLGWYTVGVDPAENLVSIAQAKGHRVECDYWNRKTAARFKHPFDIITAQNVFAHTHDLEEFLLSCMMVMRDDSLLVIQTSQANQIVNGEFDTIYHEHLSFFNTRSMRAITSRMGLVLERVEKTEIHGTSYVFLISKKGNVCTSSNVSDVLFTEEANGLYDAQTYLDFGNRAHDLLNRLRETIEMYKAKGFTTIGYGAAAKGMTVLNSGNITLDCIIDDSPLKQGLLTPGMNIPIRSRDWLEDNWTDHVLFVPLAWNFFEQIMRRINEIVPYSVDVKYVKYFPEVIIHD